MLNEIQDVGSSWPDPLILPPGHSSYSREDARKHGCVAQIDLQGETERNSSYRLEGEFYNEYRPTLQQRHSPASSIGFVPQNAQTPDLPIYPAQEAA